MSFFQSYEFRTVDRPLTKTEQKEVDGLSSRGKVSSNSALFTYDYGDFKYDPRKVTAQYFDAFFYFDDSCTQTLIFRFPADCVNIKELKCFEFEDETSLEVWKDGKYVLLEMNLYCEDANNNSVFEEDLFSDYLPLRECILKGDYCALFLFWLWYQELRSDADADYDVDDIIIPPIPANLSKVLDEKSHIYPFVNHFLTLDPAVIEAAAAFSPDANIVELSQEEFEKRVRQLPEATKTDYLIQLLAGKPVAHKIRQEIEKQLPKAQLSVAADVSLEDIFLKANELKAARYKKEKEKEEKERQARLKEIKQNEEKLWAEAETCVAQRKTNFYDQAVEKLLMLKDLAVSENNLPAFTERLKNLVALFKALSGFKTRLKDAKLSFE